MLLLLVAGGGFVGTSARYAAAGWLGVANNGWPLATFAVNILGSFVLGVLLEALARRGPETSRRQAARLFVGTGVIGSFTTYSSLAAETDLLLHSGSTALAFGYAAASLLTGLLAVVLGIAAATHVSDR